MRRAGVVPAAAVAALLWAACIEKPLRPSEREQPDGGNGEVDGGIDECGVEPAGEVERWADTDQIRFNQRTGLIDGDCRDDLVIPGSRADGLAPGVFVVLGREAGFMDGFDDFIDTGERQPIDLTLSRLVGADDALDLMVMATTPSDTFIMIFRGDGLGGFSFHAEKQIETLELQGGDAESSAPLFLLAAQLEADAEPSAVFGDSATLHIITPEDWDDAGSVEAAEVLVPDTLTVDSEIQEVGLVGAADRTLDDLFDMATMNARWYANAEGVDAFERGPAMEPGIEGPGPSVFLDMDEDGVSDVTSVRNDSGPQLETLVLVPNVDNTMPGTIGEVARLFPSPIDIGEAVSDLAVADVGSASRPDGVLVNPAFASGGKSGTMLAVYRDLAVTGDTVMADGEPLTFLHQHALSEGAPNRIAIGRFRAGVTEIRVLGSTPAVEAGFCKVLPASSDALADCAE